MVAMFLDDQRMRNVLLHSTTVAMPQPFAHVADPGRLDSFHASGTDQQIKEHVRNRSNQSELALLLANHFVSCGKGDQRFEAQSHRYRRAVRHIASDSLFHGGEFTHAGVYST